VDVKLASDNMEPRLLYADRPDKHEELVIRLSLWKKQEYESEWWLKFIIRLLFYEGNS
jgi:hypothetical protein